MTQQPLAPPIVACELGRWVWISLFDNTWVYSRLVQVYLLTMMDRTTLLHVKSTILHCPPTIITTQRASVDSRLLHRPRNIGYYNILER